MAKSDAPLRPGQRVGHYEIVEQLGEGGMGIVYRARDLNLGREAALKRPLADATTDPQLHTRFLREARAASLLTSPHIVSIFEVFEADGFPWLAMELVDGHSLRHSLSSGNPLPMEEILRHGEALSEALIVAHEKHILHRDMNPNNILITRDGRALLMDFGLAKFYVAPDQVSSATTQSNSLTGTGGVVGTPGYMAPEQLLGKPVDPRSDLFSLGAVLYEMCTGKPAFRGSEKGDVVDAILHRQPEAISRRNYEIPEELERIIRKALAKSPEERYQHPRDLRADLHGLRRQVDFQSYSDPAPSPAPRARVREQLRSLGIPVVMVALVLIVVFLALRSGRPPEEPTYSTSALVTWPGQEGESQVSPDLQWISFVSNRDGVDRIWVRKLAGGEAHPITDDGLPIFGQVWSSDANEIAYLTQEKSMAVLHVIPAPLGGRPRLHQLFDESWRRLVRWLGSDIYLESYAGSLWSFNLHTGASEEVLSLGSSLGFSQDFDVRSDGKIVFSGPENHLWMSDLHGENLVQLTADDAPAFDPRWLNPALNELVYRSNRTGRADLWRLSLDDGQSKQIPFSGVIEAVNYTSPDGSILMVQVGQEGADLWRIDSTDLSRAHLTADTRLDFNPRVSESTDTLVFQRTRSDLGVGAEFQDSEIFLASLTPDGLQNAHSIASGFLPQVSADGKWLAYLKASETVGFELRIMDLESKRTRTVTQRFPLLSFSTFPAETVAQNMTWQVEGARLFFVSLTESGMSAIHEFRPGPGEGEHRDLVSFSDTETVIRDLYLTDDGQRLGYVVTSRDQQSWELRELELESLDDRVFFSEGGDSSGYSHPLGWLPGGEALIMVRAHLNPENTWRMEILEIGRRGDVHTIGTIEHAAIATARLDAQRQTLYLTMVAGLIHNLHAFSLASGEFRQVTSNELPGVTFSGVNFIGDGKLVLVRQHRNTDLWMLRANP